MAEFWAEAQGLGKAHPANEAGIGIGVSSMPNDLVAQETKRYIGDFLAVHHARPDDNENGRRDIEENIREKTMQVPGTSLENMCIMHI